jgi:hypothetical protein
MIDPPLFTKMLLLNKNSSTINKYGFETDLKNLDQRVLRFKNMNYDTSVINNDTSNGFIKRHSKEYAKTYNKNKIIFLKLIALCVQNGVTPVVLAPPVYMNYYKAMNPQKKKKRDDLLSFIKTKNPQTLVYNFEHTESFTVKDFMNEDHLSPQGAKKFTLLIDSILKRNLNKN